MRAWQGAVLAGAVGAGALTGCTVRLGDTGGTPDGALPSISSPPVTVSASRRPAAGATDPASGLPRQAGPYIRNDEAERRDAEHILRMQNQPPSDGPKYGLGPLMAGIYSFPGDNSRTGEMMVARAEGAFPDTGAAMTDFTRNLRADGVELAPVDLPGSAGCGTRVMQGGRLSVCYLVDARTLLAVFSTGDVSDTENALKQLYPDLRH
ncbi:hypothetical protein [Actinomadura flavalba]|uniref:hypothetical protein n=1 Tax=Actinomadura flavalba TaxID=1120938 RepID=UPI000366D71D|nr:hypothetical protein [Actinomadura flavalba]